MRPMLLPALLGGFCCLAPAPAGDNPAPKPPSGFTALFNGKDLSGWKNGETEKEWKVENGTLHYTGKGGAKNLISSKDYKDFELYADWKITKAGDSGIYLRGQPQVQIWDSDNAVPAQYKDDVGKGSGGLWNNKPGTPGKQPSVNADNPVGEWNTFHIRMVGDKVTVKLNGKTVVEDAQMLEGRVPAAGPIELQVHGTPLWFRNVYVRELN